MPIRLSRRSLIRFAAGGLVAPAVLRRAAAAEVPVLLELFTSQGCSDCPPADKLAAELSRQPGLQVISYNVDYWDYLGWKDTLAKPEFSRRQMDYAKARGDNDVYTPQMVINGEGHAIGSRRGDIEAAVARARAAAAPVAIKPTRSGDMLEIAVGAGPAQAASLWVMAVAPAVSVPIARGENAGHEVVYHNVVRRLADAGSWTGAAQTFRLPLAGLIDPAATSLTCVLQAGRLGRVMGFATLAL